MIDPISTAARAELKRFDDLVKSGPQYESAEFALPLRNSNAAEELRRAGLLTIDMQADCTMMNLTAFAKEHLSTLVLQGAAFPLEQSAFRNETQKSHAIQAQASTDSTSRSRPSSNTQEILAKLEGMARRFAEAEVAFRGSTPDAATNQLVTSLALTFRQVVSTLNRGTNLVERLRIESNHGSEDAAAFKDLIQHANSKLRSAYSSINAASTSPEYSRKLLHAAFSEVAEVGNSLARAFKELKSQIPESPLNSEQRPIEQSSSFKRQPSQREVIKAHEVLTFVPSELARNNFKVGVVQRIPETGKGFGFVLVEGKEVFFHVKAGVTIEDFGGRRRLVGGYNGPALAKPGDTLLVEVEEGDRGPKAKCWCYGKEWNSPVPEKTFKPRAARIEEDMYRVMVVHTTQGSASDAPSVHWSGGTLDQLKRKFPTGRDDALRFFSNEDFAASCRFERKIAGGDWETCSDPRP